LPTNQHIEVLECPEKAEILILQRESHLEVPFVIEYLGVGELVLDRVDERIHLGLVQQFN
jgi:hypothetical protein